MHFDNFLRLSLVSISYIILIFGLGALMLKPYTKKHSGSDRILLYFVAGNFYVMNMVYLLLFVRLTNRAVTIAFLLAGAILIRYLTDKQRFLKAISDQLGTFSLLAQGAYGWRLFRKEKLTEVTTKIKRKTLDLLRYHMMEALMILGCFGLHAYYMGYRYVKYYGFGLSDELTHLEWIQKMLQGKIFSNGIYPFGFHNILYAISKIFNIDAFTTVRYFGFILVMCMLLMLLLLLKKMYRSAYAPYLGVFLYVGADIFRDTAWDRLHASLPMEFGIIFIYPTIVFLYQYICKKEKRDLVFFCISYIITMYIHYYVTIFVLIACAFMGICSFVRLIKQKMIVTILLCGILSTVISLIPMGIGYVIDPEHKVENSLRWAMGVMQNGSEVSDENSSTGTAANDTSTDSSSGNIVDNSSATGTSLQGTNTDLTKDDQISRGLQSRFQMVWASVLAVYRIVKERMINVFMNEIIFNLLNVSAILLLLKALLHVFLRSKKNEIRLQLAMLLYLISLMLLCNLLQLGFTDFIQDYRVSDYLAYAVPLIFGIPFELLYELGEKRAWSRYLIHFLILAITFGGIFYVYNGGYLKQYGRYKQVQSESAVKVYYKILKAYSKNSWTILSTVDEYSMALNNGRHEEWLTMLDKVDSKQDYTIPTKFIFMFIEKKPIIYASTIYMDKGITEYDTLNELGASDRFQPDYESGSDYYKQYRGIVMERAYCWAKKYKSYYPKEMTVFYEDNNFVCYRLVQEEGYWNSFSINYTHKYYPSHIMERLE